jgi:uncharacterized protein (DUF885 family)
VDSRLRAICDLSLPLMREGAGRHEYDGMIQDLSPGGVRAGLAALGGPPLDDPHDEAHIGAFEADLRLQLGELELHRRLPLLHMDNLDLAAYDRPYAAEAERAAAREAHLKLWPEAIEMALESLDSVSAPVASALLPAVSGLAAGVPGEGATQAAARAAHARLVRHIEEAAANGDPQVSLGADALARLMAVPEATSVDLDALTRRADEDRVRLTTMLEEACAQIDPGAPIREVVARLLADHAGADHVLDEARALTSEVMAWSQEHRLAPYLDGECIVDLSPESRRWAVAMMAWCAPGEPDAASYYQITPPDASWPQAVQEEWLTMFSRTTLPTITIHEVAPGHYAHGRALRHAPGDIRRTLIGDAFAEGWAHYVEEVAVEEGFRADDPRFAAGMAVDALCRVTRLTCALGLHTGEMDVEQATQRFETDAFMSRAGAASEARRGTFDPRYGMYTQGKWAILDLRERARTAWGTQFSLPRFHAAMLSLGSPPLGLLDEAVRIG